MRATSAPNTYIFTELLQTPQIQALASSDEFAPHLTLLQIFSHGTYSSYTSTAGLPALNDAQRLKLRQLSLLSLAKKDSSNNSSAGSLALDYASLQKALDLPSRQTLEELVISAIYAGLINAQLNPKASLVQINSVSPLRDVAPTAIGTLLSSLQSWAGRCESTLQTLSCQMTQLRADADRRAARAAARAQETGVLIHEEEAKGGMAPAMTLNFPVAASAAAAAANTAAPLSYHSTTNPNNIHTEKPSSSSTPYHNDGGGNDNNNTGNNTTNNEMNNVLTVGGGSSYLSASGSVPSTGAAGAAHLQVKPAVKRDSGQMDGNADGNGVDGGIMDMDGDGADWGDGRASKRKLAG